MQYARSGQMYAEIMLIFHFFTDYVQKEIKMQDQNATSCLCLLMNVYVLFQSTAKEAKLLMDCQEEDAILYCVQKTDTETILKASVDVSLAFHLLAFIVQC